jgi:hypothetical protein
MTENEIAEIENLAKEEIKAAIKPPWLLLILPLNPFSIM